MPRIDVSRTGQRLVLAALGGPVAGLVLELLYDLAGVPSPVDPATFAVMVSVLFFISMTRHARKERGRRRPARGTDPDVSSSPAEVDTARRTDLRHS